ncbi:SLC13 family permease [Caenispirillum salinarum]|uniref:SLC13 family permease n=1 Tax=Caenispirillum salinarum TaxID=859058 RepID=UPI00384EBF71
MTAAAARIAAILLGLGLAALPTLAWPALPPEAVRPIGVLLLAAALRASRWRPWDSGAARPWLLGALAVAAAPASLQHEVATSTALWLVAGGLVIGVAVKATGLGERLARGLVSRIGGSYGALIGGIMVVGLVLAFVMPSSMGRVVLLTPIVLSLAAALGYRHGTRGYDGLILATGLVCIVPAMAILPATVPNVVMLGAAEAQFGETLRFFTFLKAQFPGTGLARALVIALVVWVLYRQRPARAPDAVHPGPMGRRERRLAVILAAALGLWATDSLHHISPAWIAVGAAVLCFLPPDPILPLKGLHRKVNVKALIMVAALVGLGAGVAQSGMAAGLGGWAAETLPLDPAQPGWLNALVIGGLGMAASVAVTTPGVAAVVTPAAGRLAEASGLPLDTVLMAEVMGYATALLPYQVPPLLVAMSMAGVPFRQGVRASLAVAGVSVLVAWPVTLLWWAWLGLL